MCNLPLTRHSNLKKDNSLTHSCVRMSCLEYITTVRKFTCLTSCLVVCENVNLEALPNKQKSRDLPFLLPMVVSTDLQMNESHGRPSQIHYKENIA